MDPSQIRMHRTEQIDTLDSLCDVELTFLKSCVRYAPLIGLLHASQSSRTSEIALSPSSSRLPSVRYHRCGGFRLLLLRPWWLCFA